MNKIVEICCDSLVSTKTANISGAKRIELCSALQTGGITPSIGFVEEAIMHSAIPINVLVRPRTGNFLYTDDEFEIICKDIERLKKTNINGIVCGILNADGSIDKERTSKLIEISEPLSFTFHRAIDVCSDIEKGFEDLIEIGVKLVLTSGGENCIDLGLDKIIELHKKYSDKITIMPGGGLNNRNAKILSDAGITQFHFSATEFETDDFPYYRDPNGLGYIVKDNKFGNNVANLDKITNLLSQIK